MAFNESIILLVKSRKMETPNFVGLVTGDFTEKTQMNQLRTGANYRWKKTGGDPRKDKYRTLVLGGSSHLVSGL